MAIRLIRSPPELMLYVETFLHHLHPRSDWAPISQFQLSQIKNLVKDVQDGDKLFFHCQSTCMGAHLTAPSY